MENSKLPVFPIERPTLATTPGITKREYFAVMTLQGLLANPVIGPKEVLIQLSITHADELLKQLES